MLCERPPIINTSGDFQVRILRHLINDPKSRRLPFCGIETLLRHSGVSRELNLAPAAVVKGTFSAGVDGAIPPCGTSRHDSSAATTRRWQRVRRDRSLAGGGDRR